MKRRWFVLTAILAMAAVAVFLTNQVTQAQRPDRGERRDRAGGERRGGPGGMRGFNPTSIIDNSWTDLTFSLKVDDDTLIKARPVYQKHRDNLEKAIKEAGKSEDRRGLREVFGEIRNGFKTDLESGFDRRSDSSTRHTRRAADAADDGSRWRQERRRWQHGPLSHDIKTGGEMDSSILPLFFVSSTKGASRCRRNGLLS